jgi:flagellar biosynthesis protein FlhG
VHGGTQPVDSRSRLPEIAASPPGMLNGTRFDLSRLRSLGRFLVPGESPREPAGPGARVVCIASGKGGVGKSVLATNLAALRARRGERVLLVDFDAGLANLHLLLGLAPHHDLGHVLDGTIPASEAVVRGPEGIHLLSGGVGRHALANPTRRELDRLFQALRPLEQEYDLLIIDHGAGISYATVAHLAASSTLLLVTNHEVTALSDAYALYKRATTVNEHLRVGVVLNRVPDEETAMRAWERFRGVALKFLGVHPEYVGWIPPDESITRSVHSRTPVTLSDPTSPAALALRHVSAWGPLDHARTATAFYERARRALT